MEKLSCAGTALTLLPSSPCCLHAVIQIVLALPVFLHILPVELILASAGATPGRSIVDRHPCLWRSHYPDKYRQSSAVDFSSVMTNVMTFEICHVEKGMNQIDLTSWI